MNVLSCIAPFSSVSVLGPRVLRPYSNYKVSVSGGSRALNLFVAVEGKRANGEQFSQGRVIQVPEATSRLLDLEVSKKHEYFLCLIDRYIV